MQFTSAALTSVVLRHGIQLSMDGKGCWRDNIVIERLWRTLKYEEVDLHAYDSASAATTGIGRYLTLYNSRRPHSSLPDPRRALFLPAVADRGSLNPARDSSYPRRSTCTENREHFCAPLKG